MTAGAKKILRFNFDLCGECGGCVAVCSCGALELLSSRLEIKHQLCTLCQDCVTFCPTGALLVTTSQGKAPFPSQTQIPDVKDG